MAQESSKDVWFLDSGCSNHMIGNRELFSNLDDSVEFEIKLENDTVVFVMGKGVINVLTKNGKKRFIPDVYYVPGLKHNLMSVGQLIEKGYRVLFKNDVCTILDRNPSDRLIAKVQMTKNKMFPLQMYGIEEANFKVGILD